MRFGSSVQIILVLIAAFAVFAVDVIAADEGDEKGEAGRADYLDSFQWVIDKPWFGGWSGIEISPDGSVMTAITDRGRLIRAGIRRDNDRITGISPRNWWRLKSSSGNFLTNRISDSEGLAIGKDGVIHVSFEGVTRVARYHSPGAPATVLPGHETFKTFPRNNALEALAIDQQNRLYAIPEQLGKGKEIRVFVMQNSTWSLAFTLPGGDGFLPVGADFGPDGRLYLLERGWNVFGFRARVRRWDISAGKPGGEQLLLQTRTGTHDNLEGLAVWRDTKGQTRLTMIADDNFLSLQQTEIVEYVVPK